HARPTRHPDRDFRGCAGCLKNTVALIREHYRKWAGSRNPISGTRNLLRPGDQRPGIRQVVICLCLSLPGSVAKIDVDEAGELEVESEGIGPIGPDERGLLGALLLLIDRVGTGIPKLIREPLRCPGITADREPAVPVL